MLKKSMVAFTCMAFAGLAAAQYTGGTATHLSTVTSALAPSPLRPLQRRVKPRTIQW